MYHVIVCCKRPIIPALACVASAFMANFDFWPRESWSKNVCLLSPQLSRGQNMKICDGNASYSDPWCFKNRNGIVTLDAWIVAESEKARETFPPRTRRSRFICKGVQEVNFCFHEKQLGCVGEWNMKVGFYQTSWWRWNYRRERFFESWPFESVNPPSSERIIKKK